MEVHRQPFGEGLLGSGRASENPSLSEKASLDRENMLRLLEKEKGKLHFLVSNSRPSRPKKEYLQALVPGGGALGKDNI